jgi:hypothetical protein
MLSMSVRMMVLRDLFADGQIAHPQHDEFIALKFGIGKILAVAEDKRNM